MNLRINSNENTVNEIGALQKVKDLYLDNKKFKDNSVKSETYLLSDKGFFLQIVVLPTKSFKVI